MAHGIMKKHIFDQALASLLLAFKYLLFKPISTAQNSEHRKKLGENFGSNTFFIVVQA